MGVRILGIESSCDETAAAVVADGREILSNVVASQMDVHQKYGGVVPELASRQHLRSIVPVVREALDRAGMALRDVDAIGVTQGPGLVGSLLVGLTYAKALALSLKKPLVAVNHIEGHVHAVFLEAHRLGKMPPRLSAVCLIVSGGHTVLYEVLPPGGKAEAGDGKAERKGANQEIGVPGVGVSGGVAPDMVLRYRRIGQTRDDAAGEAYDKVAKLLALGYPGGPIIDQLARNGDGPAKSVGTGLATGNHVGASASGAGRSAGRIQFSPVKTKGNPYDFSFSGLKTAVLYHVRKHPEFEPEILARREALARGERSAAQLRPLAGAQTLELVSSFQRTVVAELVGRTLKAAEASSAESVLVSGGVAANSELRETFEREGERKGFSVFFPSRELSTDNAAMIAAAAYPKLIAGSLEGGELNAEAILPLAEGPLAGG
jgi:N6-L-threonylcarbamoyladenine synthase